MSTLKTINLAELLSQSMDAQRRGDKAEQSRIDREIAELKSRNRARRIHEQTLENIALLKSLEAIHGEPGYLVPLGGNRYEVYSIQACLSGGKLANHLVNTVTIEPTEDRLHFASYQSEAQRDRIIPPGTPLIRWEEAYSASGEPPNVGDAFEMPFDGNGYARSGTITQVGAHWTRQDIGRSGWYVLVEYPYLAPQIFGKRG